MVHIVLDYISEHIIEENVIIEEHSIEIENVDDIEILEAVAENDGGKLFFTGI